MLFVLPIILTLFIPCPHHAPIRSVRSRLGSQTFSPLHNWYETIILTPHATLVPLFKGTNVLDRLAKWALDVQEFQPTILHRPGSHNTRPDALSRVSVPRGRTCDSEGKR